MVLTKVFQKYFSNIFISIIQQGTEWVIYSKVVKNGAIKDKFSKTFEIQEENSIPVKMKDYLEQLQEKYRFSYVTLFLDSMGQGAISGTTAEDFEKHSVDMKNVTHFSMGKTWSVYASFIDINWAKKLFSDIGLDFLYSPFIVQKELLKKEKSKEQPTLYILNHQDSVTISIFEKGNLLFGAFFKTLNDDNISSGDEEDWENVEEESDLDELIELDHMDSNDMQEMSDELDELSDLDDLDNENHNEIFEDVKTQNNSHDQYDNEDENIESELELYGRDILIHKYLTRSLKEYYQNPLYKKSFIETIVLFDGYEISTELISMIEDELLMDIEIHKIDINEVVCDMSIKEALL